jgi:hypothetical protein
MSDNTPVENEVTAETVEFEHFGHTWTVPAKQRLSHMRKLREHYRRDANLDIALVDTFLTPEQVDVLNDIDPDEDQLDQFGDAIANAIGFKNAGNS